MGARKKGAKNPRYSKVLVIELESIIAMDLERILRSFGYGDAMLASSIEEAQGKLKKESPDLIFIDRGLEDETHGIKGGERIMHRSRIPVIYRGSIIEESRRGVHRGADARRRLSIDFHEHILHCDSI